MAGAPSEDSDQPRHLPSLIRVFAVHMKNALVLSYRLSAQQRLWSDWADAQADLSLCWAHMPLCWFCHEAAQYLALCKQNDMSRSMTSPTKWSRRSESSLCTQWEAKDPRFLHADSKDSDQTGQMPRLIGVFAGRTGQFTGFVMQRLKCKNFPYFIGKSNSARRQQPFSLQCLFFGSDSSTKHKKVYNYCRSKLNTLDRAFY